VEQVGTLRDSLRWSAVQGNSAGATDAFQALRFARLLLARSSRARAQSGQALWEMRHGELMPTQAFLYKTFLGSPLKLWASVGHWLIWHFNLDLYTEKQRPQVRARTQVISGFGLPPVRGSAIPPGPARSNQPRGRGAQLRSSSNLPRA